MTNWIMFNSALFNTRSCPFSTTILCCLPEKCYIYPYYYKLHDNNVLSILLLKYKECMCACMHVYILPENRTLANFDITIIIRNIKSPKTLFVTTYPPPRVINILTSSNINVFHLFLNFIYKWNYTVYTLCVWLLLLNSYACEIYSYFYNRLLYRNENKYSWYPIMF